jgi:hypothetical protein
MATIEKLRSLLAKLKGAKGPSPELDAEIAIVLGRMPPDERPPPAWTASIDEALELFNELLPGRPMEIVGVAENAEFVCTVKLHGNMPATPPYAVDFAKTAALAVVMGLIDTLIALEIDYWS